MIKFRGDDFLEFINKRAEQIDRKPAASPAGVCILPGQLLRRNLQDHLDRSGIPTATLSHFTTIEELASDLLDTANEPSGMLSEGLRQQLIAAACHQFDPNPDIPDDVTIPEIEFTDEAIGEIADFAFRVNENTQNIGARRLHTIMEKLVEKISFKAPEMEKGKFVIDVDYVREQLSEVVQDEDLSKYIL